MVLDLDEFKLINDSHGHEAGDAILIEVANRLAYITRTEDIIGRLGGDEFIVVMGNLNTGKQEALDRAKFVADRLVHIINKPVDFNGKQLQVGVSIGICFLDFEKNVTIDQLVSNADSAMYLTKKAGKGHAAFFQN